MDKTSAPHEPQKGAQLELPGKEQKKEKSLRGDAIDPKAFSRDRDAFIEMLSQHPEFESCW